MADIIIKATFREDEEYYVRIFANRESLAERFESMYEKLRGDRFGSVWIECLSEDEHGEFSAREWSYELDREKENWREELYELLKMREVKFWRFELENEEFGYGESRILFAEDLESATRKIMKMNGYKIIDAKRI